jgi:CHAD domain-containing protein/CYTH domain-containing protein
LIQLDRALLSRSPEETTRHLCLGLLEEANQALGRFERDDDEEGLHDFRVALRRLRSVVRVYKPYLKGSARKKLRKRLSALADSTNAARDLEVQKEWLSREDSGLPEDAQTGARNLLGRLEAEAADVSRPAELRAEFDDLHRSLRKSMSRLRLRMNGGGTFLSVTGELIGESASQLSESLASIGSAEEGEKLHAARIEAKRLRYLLEPISAEHREAHAFVKEMKTLQDALGELQDARVLSQKIGSELERSAVEEAQRLRDLALQDADLPIRSAPADPGLLALLRAQRDRRDRQYLSLSRSWLSGNASLFFDRVLAFARALEATSHPPKPPRRFLLVEVPERAKRRTPTLVRQAFLPGRKIHELVEAVGSGERARCSRVTSAEDSRFEERISSETFDRFWSLSPMRLERARYQVRENGRTYSIDEVRSEEALVLAEIAGDPDEPLPEWLESAVKREVTGQRRYEWEALASRLNARARSAPGTPADPPAAER